MRFSLLMSLFTVLSLLSPAVVSAAPSRFGSDYNGDGVSDLFVVDQSQTGGTVWKIFSGVDDSLLTEVQSSALPTDFFAPAKWLEPSKTNLLSISPTSSGGLTWRLLDGGSTPRSFNFGKKTDLILSGGDFNGDGLTDAVTVRKHTLGILRWSFKSAPFVSSATAKRLSTRALLSLPGDRFFGTKNDLPFFVSPDGKVDWLGIATRIGSKARVILMHPQQIKFKTFQVPTSAWGGKRPFPVRRASGEDWLAFPKTVSDGTQLTFTNLKGKIVGSVTLKGSTMPITGGFSGNETADIGLQNGKTVSIYNPLARSLAEKGTNTGVVVGEVNVGRYQQGSKPGTPTPAPTSTTAPQKTPTPTPTTQPTALPIIDNPPPPAGSLAQICTDMHAPDRSWLYKPGSGGTNDPRTGRPTFLWYEGSPHPNVRKVYVLASNGAQIGVMGYYFVSPYPLSRYYSGFSPGTMESAKDLENKAKAASGSGKIYFYTQNGLCWGGCNPGARCGGR